MELIVDNKGLVRCLYEEAIPLAALGSVDIKRASAVEPTSEGQWTADLSPVAGPIMGPFATRSEALAAEREWLLQNWLPPHSIALICPHCGSRELAYAEYIQRMYRRCEEQSGVLVCHSASDVVNWEASQGARLCCRRCDQQFPLPAGHAIDFV